MICKENPAAKNSGWGKRWGRCFHFIMFSLGQRDRQKFGISPGPLRVFVCIFRSLKYVVPKFCHHCCRFVGFLLSFLPRCEYILSDSKPEVTSLILGCTKPIRQNDWTTALWNKSFPLPHFLSTWQTNVVSSELLCRRISRMKEILSITTLLWHGEVIPLWHKIGAAGHGVSLQTRGDVLV